MSETPTSRLQGGFTTINCTLALMLEEQMLKNFHNYSILILFSASGLTKFRMMLLKIYEQQFYSSHWVVRAECFSFRKVLWGQSQIYDKSERIPALKTVAPIENTSDLVLAVLSTCCQLAIVRSSGASRTQCENQVGLTNFAQFVDSNGKDTSSPIFMLQSLLMNTFYGLMSPTTPPRYLLSILTAVSAQRRQYSCPSLNSSFSCWRLLIQSERRQGNSGQLTCLS